jgi:hypothetical protein
LSFPLGASSTSHFAKRQGSQLEVVESAVAFTLIVDDDEHQRLPSLVVRPPGSG